jgi:hypothetical protein
MTTRNRRIRRATLRGWWLGLVIVLPPFLVLFSFTWFETHRLDNEFIAGELAESIQKVNEKNQTLELQIRKLRNLDRLSEKASAFALREALPGQRVVLRPSSSTLKSIYAGKTEPPKQQEPTRVVLVKLKGVGEPAIHPESEQGHGRLALRMDHR